MEENTNNNNQNQSETAVKQSASQSKNNKNKLYLGPIILILLGVILLLNNMGVNLPWQYIWPILIIVVGFLLIFNRGLLSGGLIALLIIIVVFAAIFSLFNTSFFKDLGLNIENISTEKMDTTTKNLDVAKEKYAEVDEIDFSVDVGIGEYTLTNQKKEDTYLTTEGKYNYETFEPVLNENFSNSRLSLEYSTKDVISLFGFNNPVSIYDLNLSDPTIKTNFDLNIGTGSADIELADQQIGELNLNVGTGDMDVELQGENNETAISNINIGTGQAYVTGLLSSNIVDVEAKVGTGKLTLQYDGEPISELYEMSIDLGTGTVNIQIPSAIGYIIDPDVGTGDIEINGQSIDQDKEYESENYDEAEVMIKFDFDIGTGQVNIEELE